MTKVATPNDVEQLTRLCRDHAKSDSTVCRISLNPEHRPHHCSRAIFPQRQLAGFVDGEEIPRGDRTDEGS